MESALEGRVLVLEGVEKAERNVLPVLNNLLENREMQLDDGHLIVAPQRYDRLVEVSFLAILIACSACGKGKVGRGRAPMCCFQGFSLVTLYFCETP